MISPNAAVDLPLPEPVWTISSPFSVIVLEATSASCTALSLRHLDLVAGFVFRGRRGGGASRVLFSWSRSRPQNGNAINGEPASIRGFSLPRFCGGREKPLVDTFSLRA